jgi:hypothetical protein
MDEIKNIIPQVIGQLASKQPETQDKIRHLWDSLIDKKTAPHVNVAGLKKGELLVNVDSPAWLFQMNLQKRKITETFKKEIPDIISIRFRIGKTYGEKEKNK